MPTQPTLNPKQLRHLKEIQVLNSVCSSFRLLKRAQTQVDANRQPINTLLNELGRGELVLQDTEYETILALIKFLENFKKFVDILSSETQPTMNMILVFRSEVKRLLEEANDDEPLVNITCLRVWNPDFL
ncbi:unnamed protein product [Parnassius apollo]|uniref:(apollo) hypothetical protein n=1 Tax=Parnassius apollo TaxID=110799 RepID=A0A8S3XKG6_PARAO|nr:unnamed protein product [Parnassius apollo]